MNDLALRHILLHVSDSFKHTDLEGYLYGSAQYKLNPHDLDILLPLCTMANDAKKIHAYIDVLRSQGAVVTSIDPYTGVYGYRHETRHVIPVLWHGVNLEFIVYPGTVSQHANDLDFTVGARYLHLKTRRYVEVPGIYAAVDINRRQLHAVVDPEVSFLYDPRRIFRAVRLIADENFTLSADCEQAIQAIFCRDQNPFITHINPKKIYYQMQVMQQSEQFVAYLEVLSELGILNKLYEVFIRAEDASGQYYRDVLTPFYRAYHQAHVEPAQAYGQHRYRFYDGSAMGSNQVMLCEPMASSGLY